MNSCKVCIECNKQKKLYQFKVHNATRGNRLNVCRVCRRKEVVDVKSTRDKINEYFKEKKC